MAFRRFRKTFGRIQRRGVRCVEIALLYPSLFLLYYVGLGGTRLAMSVLARGMLRHRPPGGRHPESYWRPAEGYGLEQAELERQS